MAVLGLLGVLASPVTEVVKCLTLPIVNQIQYIIQYEKNTNKLRLQLEALNRKRDDVNGSIDAARRRGESIKHGVQAWIERVDLFHAEAMGFLNDGSIQESAKSCIVGCPSRYRIGKKAKRMLNAVNKLRMEGEFDVISEIVPPPSIEFMPAGDFEVFDVTKVAMERVMEALKDGEVNLIGVYGMGGVGKTMLMKEVVRQVRMDGLFDEVVMATVSQNIDLKRVQGEIAESLGLTLQEEIEFPRARRLLARLKQQKRILVILDDLWARINLFDVGIPLLDAHNGCKVVITTRSLDVCSVMEVQVKVEVEVLSEKDSWFLFRKKVGDIVDTPSLSTVSQEVAKECKGLPLAIVTLGLSLRDKNRNVWNDVASQLRKSISTNLEGMSATVFSCIKLSYDYLESRETKLCFLLCCLFPEDHKISIEVLMLYMVGEGLFGYVETLEEARGRTRMISEKLKASCLLIKCVNDEYVMMHDIIRDVAISIASEEANGFLPKSGIQLTQWPEREKLDKYIRISLMTNKINQLPLPSEPFCPNLCVLLLQNNNSLTVISNSFFEQMKNLAVLDLSYTYLSVLPQSISCLTQLRTLRLEFSPRLENIYLIGKLINLEVLSLGYSAIHILPEEIGGLTKLRLLNLSCTRNLKSVPPKVISNLSRLEELYMPHSFSGWEAEGGDGINASLCEVTSLTNLTALYLHVNNSKCLSINIPNNWENLQRFCISFNDKYRNSNAARSMCLNTASFVSNWVKVLLDKTEELNLVSCKGFKNVAQLNAGGFNNLLLFCIQKCNDVDYILDEEAVIQESVFASLKELKLIALRNLKKICYGPLPNGFFKNLVSLKVQSCHKLINLLSPSLLLSLQNLEVLEASSCYELKDVFEYGGPEDRQRAPLPKLKVLHLLDLPRLRYTFSPSMVQRFQRLEEIKIVACDEMLTLIFEGEDGQPSTSVTSNESTAMVQLSSTSYSSLTPHVFLQNPDLDNILFASLKTLQLDRLPKLSSLYQGQRGLVWPSLEELKVLDCPNLKTLPFSPQNAPKLRIIEGNEDWFSGLEWSDESVKLQLQPLFRKHKRFHLPTLHQIAKRVIREARNTSVDVGH